MTSSPHKYRPCVGIMLINQDRHVFVGKRIDTDTQAWQMPQGGVDEGEQLDAAVFREMCEEIGTDKAEIITKSRQEYFYDFPADVQKKVWDGQYLGQRQAWYLLKFTGQDSDINLHTSTPEFSDWRWCPITEVERLIVDFKRSTYRAVISEFMPKILTAF